MFNKILVPLDVDYPNTSKTVYENARDIAKMSGAKIRVVGVMPGFSMPLVASFVPDEIQQEALANFTEALETFVTTHCDENVNCEVLVGKNWEVILKMAEKWGADLIVVYHNHRRPVNEAFSGTCANRIVKRAKCSVLRLRNIFSRRS